MDANGDRAGSQAGYVGDFGRSQVVEIEQEDLSVCRSQFAYERGQALAGATGSRLCLDIVPRGEFSHVFKPDEVLPPGSTLRPDVIGSRIVRHAINPGPHRAAPIVAEEASPKGDVNLLDKIPAKFSISFIAAREPLDRRRMRGGGLPVAAVLVELAGSHIHHDTVVGRGSRFLQ